MSSITIHELEREIDRLVNKARTRPMTAKQALSQLLTRFQLQNGGDHAAQG